MFKTKKKSSAASCTTFGDGTSIFLAWPHVQNLHFCLCHEHLQFGEGSMRKKNCFGVGFLFVCVSTRVKSADAGPASRFICPNRPLYLRWFILGKKAKDEDAEQAVDKEG